MAVSGFYKGAINVDADPAVYYSGQVVSGSVFFDLEQPLNFSVLYIQFLGEANVSWIEIETERINGVENEKRVDYLGREEYVNLTQPLAGGAGPAQLPVGSHNLPFKFQIPITAPSTFVGEKGHITYSLTAYLMYPDGVTKEDLNKEIEVVAPFDLNLGSPRIREPIDLEFEELHGCGCFCNPDPVTVRIRLPLSGYCPGQTIPVAVEVDNESNVEITKMKFQLVSKELYRSIHPASEYVLPEKFLVSAKSGPVMGHSKRNFTYNLKVPHFIAPYLENCTIIDVGYFFRITIKLSGCTDDLDDEAEICLGLVPVSGFLEGEYTHPLANRLPKGPIPVAAATELLPPPAAVGLNGSTSSLQRLQYNAVTSAYPSNPPPYPSGNVPYLSQDTFQSAESIEMKPKPGSDYQIGFKAPTVPVGNVPYTPMFPNPYASQTAVAGGPAPYPTNMAAGNNGLPPHTQGGFVPSAPPPTD
ncbi:arrestin domain-containing protein 2-like [Trichoplusia ni]|uniref:Arrestin domain-containing protein 2-like n=1 Tax=Trichoplusia ni TaxID=7111 RepID=A0A7E5WKW4_TRINI|nr:arrestin domain-containing protein 2-like [Trichoplusia ni]